VPLSSPISLGSSEIGFGLLLLLMTEISNCFWYCLAEIANVPFWLWLIKLCYSSAMKLFLFYMCVLLEGMSLFWYASRAVCHGDSTKVWLKAGDRDHRVQKYVTKGNRNRLSILATCPKWVSGRLEKVTFLTHFLASWGTSKKEVLVMTFQPHSWHRASLSLSTALVHTGRGVVKILLTLNGQV
jgi:hypothetical protein